MAIGCDRRSAATADVVTTLDTDDGKPASDLAPVGDEPARDAFAEAADGFDVALEADTDVDAAPDADADVAVDAPRDADAGPDAPTLRADVEVEGIDATTPDEGAVELVVTDACAVARFDGARDDGPPCTPGRARACTCADGRTGAETCLRAAFWGACVCAYTDGGLAWEDDAVADVPDAPIPWIGRPRLLAPQSGARATSTRPTFRWLLPAGVARARLERCADRPCARVLAQQEVAGNAWRAEAPLAPGVAFWRVRGLDPRGVVVWTSATWEFAVPRRDRGVDISYGAVKDFDGDGFDDLAVSGNRGSWEGGAGVLVYMGSAAGLDERRAVALNPPFVPGPVGSVSELERYGDFAESFSVGDVNGDGLADLVVGAPGYTGSTSSLSPGRVFTFLGRRGCVVARDEAAYRPVDDAIDRFGAGVTLGDFNGDGYADLVATGAHGTAQLHLGGAGGLAEAPADVSAVLGPDAHFVGDLNGDGYADLVARHWELVPQRLVPALVLYGNPEARLALRVQALRAEVGDYYLGHQARGADFNEDGYGDVAVSGFGKVYVLYGSPDGLRDATLMLPLYAGPAGDTRGNFGGFLAVGDFDGDGHLELAISQLVAPAVRDPELRLGPGMAHFYLRRSGTSVLDTAPTFSITGSPPGGIGFGRPTAPGDINGDGGDDLALGAASVGRMGPSQLWVYHGGTIGWQRAPTATFTRNYAFQVTTK